MFGALRALLPYLPLATIALIAACSSKEEREKDDEAAVREERTGPITLQRQDDFKREAIPLLKLSLFDGQLDQVEKDMLKYAGVDGRLIQVLQDGRVKTSEEDAKEDILDDLCKAHGGDDTGCSGGPPPCEGNADYMEYRKILDGATGASETGMTYKDFGGVEELGWGLRVTKISKEENGLTVFDPDATWRRFISAHQWKFQATRLHNVFESDVRKKAEEKCDDKFKENENERIRCRDVPGVVLTTTLGARLAIGIQNPMFSEPDIKVVLDQVYAEYSKMGRLPKGMETVRTRVDGGGWEYVVRDAFLRKITDNLRLGVTMVE